MTWPAKPDIQGLDKTKSRRELAMAWCPQFLSVRRNTCPAVALAKAMDCSHLPLSARTRWVTERIASRRTGAASDGSGIRKENAGSNGVR